MLNRLDNALDHLRSRMADLESRLIPVLAPRDPVDAEGLAFGANTAMGARIRDQLDTVDSLIRRVHALNENLEV